MTKREAGIILANSMLEDKVMRVEEGIVMDIHDELEIRAIAEFVPYDEAKTEYDVLFLGCFDSKESELENLKKDIIS